MYIVEISIPREVPQYIAVDVDNQVKAERIARAHVGGLAKVTESVHIDNALSESEKHAAIKAYLDPKREQYGHLQGDI